MIDLESLSLTEMIRLRERISENLVGRFERMLAVAQVEQAAPADLERLARAAGRIVPRPETGGALACFPSVDAAVAALVEMFERSEAPEPRAAVHWAPVLTDGELVVGDPVALGARVAAAGAPGELRLTRPAYVELASRFRLRCQPAPAFESRGGKLLELVVLHWRRAASLPTRIRVRESGEELRLPDKPVVTVGRAAVEDGPDVAVVLPERRELGRISRRHIELRRELDELYCHPLSDQPTEVDGQSVARGERARISPGSIVRLGGAATLTFLGDEPAGKVADESVLQTMMVGRQKV